MGVYIHTFIVEWDKFVNSWEETEDYNRAIQESQIPRLKAGLDDYYYSTSCFFERIYESFSDSVSDPWKKDFEYVVYRLFYPHEDGKHFIEDLPDTGAHMPDEGYSLTISPNTISKLLEKWENVKIDEWQSIAAKNDVSLKEFQSFKDYADNWINLLKMARENNAGFVAWIF